MSKLLIKEVENLLEKNQVPYMEILNSQEKNIDLIINVYFPKIISTVCKTLNDYYGIKNKDKVVISKDTHGFYKVKIGIHRNNNIVNIQIGSILKNTWGIAS